MIVTDVHACMFCDLVPIWWGVDPRVAAHLSIGWVQVLPRLLYSDQSDSLDLLGWQRDCRVSRYGAFVTRGRVYFTVAVSPVCPR